MGVYWAADGTGIDSQPRNRSAVVDEVFDGPWGSPPPPLEHAQFEPPSRACSPFRSSHRHNQLPFLSWKHHHYSLTLLSTHADSCRDEFCGEPATRGVVRHRGAWRLINHARKCLMHISRNRGRRSVGDMETYPVGLWKMSSLSSTEQNLHQQSPKSDSGSHFMVHTPIPDQIRRPASVRIYPAQHNRVPEAFVFL